MSPLKVLSRGYSIARRDGQVIQRIDQTEPGDRLEILITDGKLLCQVEGKENTNGSKKQMSFEQAMDRLEEIVKKLESGDGSLDQALTLFEEGSKLAGACTAMLDQAEQKVTKLLSLESSAEAPFDADNSQGTN